MNHSSNKILYSLTKILLAGIWGLQVIYLPGCTYEQTPLPPQPGKYEIFLRNIEFQPSEKSITKGNSITFVQKDRATHRTQENNGLFDSGDMSQGDTFKYMFKSPGTYHIFCQYHPSMTGKVIVNQ